ncbi:MAG: DUF4013 domain-containing protein [Candidatus Bathyarchaeota archaeon]|nr:DUF4013 domain-containing protein [Candidatus Bathyarchaeota archaeon]
MRVEETFGEAFNYTKDFSKDVGRLIVLAILSIIPVINFVVLGYACKVVRQTPASNVPPKLEEFLKMWINGLKVVVVSVVYMIIPLIVALTAGLVSPAWFNQPIFSIIFSSVLFLVGLVLAFIFSIILVIGVVHMVKTDNFSKAFAISEIIGIIGKIGWGKYLIWLIVVFIIGIVVSTIGSIPFIGWIILMFATPLFTVFVARSITILYSGVQQEAVKSSI